MVELAQPGWLWKYNATNKNLVKKKPLQSQKNSLNKNVPSAAIDLKKIEK